MDFPAVQLLRLKLFSTHYLVVGLKLQTFSVLYESWICSTTDCH